MESNRFGILLIALLLAAMACRTVTPSESAPGGGNTSPQEALSGEQIFERSGCSGCHNGPAGIAPSLEGVYGEEVVLEGGETVTVDEGYLRESILSPQVKIVSGYQPVMPDYQDRLSAEEVEALVEYIRGLEG